MFKIAVTLRKAQAPNVFRRTLLAVVKSGIADEFLLTSGYYQDFFKSPYKASDAFQANPSPHPGKTSWTFVRGMPGTAWHTSFALFIKNIGNISCTKCGCGGPAVSARKAQQQKWHAKVFIARAGGTPVLAIVGSSNITRPAFDETAPWNNECDVIIWDAGHVKLDAALSSAWDDASELARPGNDDRNGRDASPFFVANYDPGDRRNRDNRAMNRRLDDLWADIIESSTDI